MKNKTKTIKTTQRAGTLALLTERALAGVVGGDDGVIHAESAVRGGALLPNGISGSGR